MPTATAVPSAVASGGERETKRPPRPGSEHRVWAGRADGEHVWRGARLWRTFDEILDSGLAIGEHREQLANALAPATFSRSVRYARGQPRSMPTAVSRASPGDGASSLGDRGLCTLFDGIP